MRGGVSDEKLAEIETHIAQILQARDACIDFEVLINGLSRRGILREEDRLFLLDRADLIRIGLQRGQKFALSARRASAG